MDSPLIKNVKEIIAILLGNYIANFIAPLFDYRYEGPIEPMFQGQNIFLINGFLALIITAFTALIFWLIFKIITRKRYIGFFKILGVALFAQLIAMAIYALGSGLGGGMGLILLPVVSSAILNLLAWRKVFPAETQRAVA